jgi:hypothetical protein
MMKRVVGFYVMIAISYSCGQVENASDDSVAGTYVREYSKEIMNQLSGNKVGMRTVRDTLYITEVGDAYQIKNAKWRMNDYDNDGWQNMEHGELGPWPSFEATYEDESKSLKSKSSGDIPALMIDESGKLSVGGKSEIAYNKID